MKIGSLGKIIFRVSTNEIKTISGMNRKRSAKIQEHERHLNKDLPEFMGRGLETIKFEMRVSRYLGSKPSEDIRKVVEYLNNGTALKLIIGRKTYGYRWLIQDYDISYTDFDKSGNLVEANIVLNLKEYPKI